MGVSTGCFLLAGALAAAALALGTDIAGAAQRVTLLVGGAAAVLGAVLLRWGVHLPRTGYHVVVVVGTGMVTTVAALAPSPATALATAALYVFVTVDVFFFFAPREALAQHLLVLVAAVGTLWSRGAAWGHVVTTVLAWSVVAAVVGHLANRASEAGRDSLTGLANRRGFDAALDAAVPEALRTGAALSLALLDVDHFKRVNDRFGHAAGDELLRALARECAAAMPREAVLARFGGDEFAVLLPGLRGPRACELLEQLVAGSTRVGLSCGVAELQPGEEVGDLLRRADSALYAAKSAGRGQCRLSGGTSAELVADLREALAAGDVRAHVQPVVALPAGRLVAVEALARWTHPLRGPVSPAEFVPVAEASGLIGELGAAVLADACAAAVELREQHPGLRVTVNVSGRELTAPGYPARVLRTLRASGLPASALVLEVTESLLDASSEVALRALAELRRLGVAVAIDDFGTGWSAFSRLDTLPADYLKLDAGFIAEITTSPRRAGMLQALLALSRTLGLQVVAEGVETTEQADLLSRLGCPLAQGWFFGRPVPPEDLDVPAAAASPAGERAGQRAAVGR
ncbi:putative bifunctional diguanylate cyclase/phosphodiesterase [Kineococcus terrestris]|uniref:putative bifunctional diguanylate cyclase/phosphodiesterase n=1 Tax=Kineococcus terrestris TaxID=2044856 RepID=UPI0034DB6BEF